MCIFLNYVVYRQNTFRVLYIILCCEAASAKSRSQWNCY